MRTRMYEVIEANRDKIEYSHGGLVGRISQHVAVMKNAEIIAHEACHKRPCKQDLRYGRRFDTVLRQQNGRKIDLEVLVHKPGDKYEALMLANTKRKYKCSVVVVVCKEYDEAFASYCLLKGIEAYEFDGDYGGEIVLKPIKL